VVDWPSWLMDVSDVWAVYNISKTSTYIYNTHKHPLGIEAY